MAPSHSKLSLEVFALSWKIVKYGLPPTGSTQHLQSFQQTEVDGQAIELLAPCIKALSDSLCAPIPLGDINEKERERKLEW